MLTPVELQNKTFKSGGLGYDKKDVEQFFREVTDEFTRLYSENIDLKDRVDALNEALQRYKTMESTLQKALVLAEKTAEDTTQAAVQNARNIEKEAQLKSQIIMADARNELEHVRTQTMGLLQQFEKYKLQFKSLAAAQIELLESDSYSINKDRLEAFIDTSRSSLPHTEELELPHPKRTEEMPLVKDPLKKGKTADSRHKEEVSLGSLEKNLGHGEEIPERFSRKQSQGGKNLGRSDGNSYWPDGRFPGRVAGKTFATADEKKFPDNWEEKKPPVRIDQDTDVDEDQNEDEFDFIDL